MKESELVETITITADKLMEIFTKKAGNEDVVEILPQPPKNHFYVVISEPSIYSDMVVELRRYKNENE